MSIRSAPLHTPPPQLAPDRTQHDPPALSPVNLLDSIRSHRTGGRTSLAGAVEDCFLRKFDSIDYDLNAVTVKSTIAIALSPDGSTVATTHGDHTVKIFKYADASLYRVFVGHPRTPWTVKYHYTNSDIVASGCLGYEIFVWSISENCKINSIRYSNSIISLSFQPHGPYIAVASGMELRLWNWSEDARLSIDGPTGRILQSRNAVASDAAPGDAGADTNWKQCPRMKIVRHPRNIRAVIFHPFGRVLFVAAPDVTDIEPVTVVYSRLYAFDISSISIDPDSDIEAAASTINLTTLPSILPQVHLYSDGGIDVSPDGQFLFVCCSLYQRTSSAFLSRSAAGINVDGLTRELSGLELSDDTSGDYLYSRPVIKDDKREDTTGYTALSTLCLYRFRYPVDDSIDLTILPSEQPHGFINSFLRDTPFPQLELVKYRPVKEALLKAITTVKLSPMCRYGLLGYGVRANGLVEGHIYGHITSEIVSLDGSDMAMATMMTDEVDEVNIAQFHPLPGGGIIYGTKLGRVRVFKRADMINNN